MSLLLAAGTPNSLHVGQIAMELLGGLAIFLFGMDLLSEALRVVAGDGVKRLLARLTTNRFTGALAGALVTAIIQSSSITTVLVVGFISAGLMSLTQSVGVIMGANIGTTITAQIIAFKVTQYALVLVAAGFLMRCAKSDRLRDYGSLLLGLGLVFYGMSLMSSGTHPLRDYEPFIRAMQRMDDPLLAVILGALFTALVQSSSATTGIVIVMAAEQLISLHTGIALILGANIGTCVTAILATLGKPREAVRAAVVHVLFNVLGVVLWFGLIDQLARLVTWVSPAADTPRQIANAHTVFNAANTLVLIWFAPLFVLIVKRLVPERREVTPPSMPRYLDDVLLQTPSLAMDIVRMELGRLGAAALRMVRQGLPTVLDGDETALQQLEDMDDDVDALHEAIVTYLGRLARENLSDLQSRQLHDYLAAANYLESIGDMIETNLVAEGKTRLRQHLTVSPATREVLELFHHEVCDSVEEALRALVGQDAELARHVTARKSDVNRICDRAESHLARRLSADEPNRLAAFRLESEIIEYLKRVYYFAKRIAKLVELPEESQDEARHEEFEHAEPMSV